MNPKIVKELNRIAKSNGGVLQPEQVVDSAKRKASPLHRCFTWNNSEAAHEYRLWQARRLIAVVVEIVPRSNVKERAWVSLKSDRSKGPGGYRPIVSILTDEELRKQLLSDALCDLRVLERKYSRLSELAGVFKAFRKVQMLQREGEQAKAA